MALGVVSDDLFEEELSRVNQFKQTDNQTRIAELNIGRGNKPETPEVIREIIAEEVINGADRQMVSSAYKISQSSISAYKNGATSTASYNEPDTRLAPVVNDVKDRIATKARSRLMQALKEITPDKLRDVRVRDLAGIARDMSAVIKNIELPTPPQLNNNVQFVFYSPKQKQESDYPVIQVNE